MAQKNFFDQIKQVIDDRTKKPEGLVVNLHGTIADTPVVSDATSNQSWYGLQAELTKLPTLREFVDAFTHQRLPVAEISSLNGTTTFPESGALRSGVAALLYTSVNFSGPDALPIKVVAPGHAIAIYVDDVVKAQGVGTLDATIALAGGQQFIAVLCYGSANAVAVTVDEKYALQRGEPTPPAPHLEGNPTSSYLAAKNGSFVVDLKWHNDSYASGWNVYRAQAQKLGKILAFSSANGRFTATIQGSLGIATGTRVYTSKFFAGTVTATSATTFNSLNATIVTVDPDSTSPNDSVQWVGNDLYSEGTSYSSIATASYSGESIISYQDLTVRQGGIYTYKITALGFIVGIAESDYSNSGWVVVDDLTPPGDITFDTNTDVRIVNGEIQLTFHTPSDEDYHGVKVYLEDATDPTQQELVTTELGIPDEQDQIAWRPPRQGKYWLRTFDWAGNVQPIGQGKLLNYDGNARWSRAIQGVLVGAVDDAAGTVTLSLAVDGLKEMFPATVTFYNNGLADGNRINLDGNGKYEHVMQQAGTVSSGTYAALGSIPLPEQGLVHFWAKIEDKDGFVTYADTQADRGVNPDGNVALDDYLAFPSIAMIYDEDVESIVLTVPDPQTGGTLGTRTYTRLVGGGLVASGGGMVIYTVGSIIDKAGGGTTTEKTIPVDASRGDYKVEFKHGTVTNLIWQGKLHGAASAAPAIEIRYELDETTKDAADVYVRVTSTRKEPVTIEVRDDDDLSLPVWQMVDAESSATLKYLDDGQETSWADWFRSDVDGTGPTPPTWAQKLNNIPLKSGQTKFLNIRAITKDSKIPSSWMRVAMPLKEVPVISGVALIYDEATSQLALSATGGVHCKSARYEMSDDETFAVIRYAEDKALLAEGTYTSRKNMLDSERGKTWFGRVIPFNGALSNTATPTVTGLGGIPMRDSEYVPGLAGTEPSGIVDLTVDDAGAVTLKVTPQNNTLSFQYVVSDTAQPTTRSGSNISNFSGTNPVSVSLTPALLAGKRRFVTVWFFEKANASGGMGRPVTKDVAYVTAAPPYFDGITQIRDTTAEAAGEIRIDFQVRVADPINRGGTLKIWTNKNGLTSPNPAGAPEQTIVVPNTPATFSPGSASMLDNVLSNAQKDKFVYFEFVNTQGQSTGKKEVKVTTEWVDVGTDGKINDNAITYNKLSSDLSPYRRVTALPATGQPGDAVILLTDGQTYIYFNGAWKKALDLPDLLGKIGTEYIKQEAITTALLASNIAPLVRVSALPASGAIGDVVILSTDNKIYRWTGTAWTSGVPTTDLFGQVLKDQIADGAISIAKFADGLQPIQRVPALPGQGVVGQVVLLTTDGKLYRWTGSAWTASVAAVDLTGVITNTQIADDAITGPKILAGEVDANKLYAGSVQARRIQAVNIAAGVITADLLYAGAVQANLIQAANIATDAIRANHILAGEIKAGKLYAGVVQSDLIQANNIAVGVITADKLYAGVVQASLIQATNIATDAIRANHIKAGEIVVGKLAADAVLAVNIKAGEVTATKINVTQLGSDVAGIGITQNLGIIVAGILYNNSRTNFINLNATGTTRVLQFYNSSTGKGFYVQADGTANFAGDIIASQNSSVYASTIKTNGLQPLFNDYIMIYGKLQGSSNPNCTIDLNIAAGSSSLFINSPNFTVAADGTVTLGGKGQIQTKDNVGNVIAYLNLTASGTTPILYHPKLSLLADGSANFSGKLRVGGATDAISFVDGDGITVIGAVYCSPSAGFLSPAHMAFQFNGYSAMKITTGGITVDHPNGMVVAGPFKVTGNGVEWSDLNGNWKAQYSYANVGVKSSANNWLNWLFNGSSVIRFKYDGDIEANSFSAYSPTPPKPRHTMSAKDWMSWAAEDAMKPVWPHKEHGMPHPEHPEVVRRAKASQNHPVTELEMVASEYKKDISKIAIGTANWAHLVMKAIEDAKDFDDFKRRLGLK